MPRSKLVFQFGVQVVVNDQPHHFSYLRMEYPTRPGEQPAELAPGLPGFWVVVVRAKADSIRWMEACFASGVMKIEVLRKRPPVVVQYSQPVDSLTETPRLPNRIRLLPRLSASFGFYQVAVVNKASG